MSHPQRASPALLVCRALGPPHLVPPLAPHPQAFATDAEDQSPWMYYRWLLGNSLAHVEAATALPAGPRREQQLGEARLVLGEVQPRWAGWGPAGAGQWLDSCLRPPASTPRAPAHHPPPIGPFFIIISSCSLCREARRFEANAEWEPAPNARWPSRHQLPAALLTSVPLAPPLPSKGAAKGGRALRGRPLGGGA
jgi:hypothetical protein